MNEAGLTLTQAVAKAMVIHTGERLEPDQDLADRIMVVTWNPEGTRPKLVVVLFATAQERQVAHPFP
jgi:hypothetical protein